MTRTTPTLTESLPGTLTTRAAAILAAVLAVVLAGCGSSGNADTSGAAPAAPSSSTASPATSLTASVSSSPTPAADSGPSPDAVNAAAAAFTTWDQPTRTYAAWWAHLKPLLSAGGRLAFAGTDPANIPALTLTGPYQLDPKPPDDPDTTALVHVATKQGTFGLLLSRSGPGADWFLLQINFPPGIH